MTQIRLLHEMVLAANSACPDKQAVLQKDKAMTYGETCERSQRLGNVLQGLGISKGDRVAFFLEKCFEKVICIFGISMAGGVFVPVRTRSLGSQVAHIIQDCESGILITTYSRLPTIKDHLAEMPALKTIIAIGARPDATVEMPGVVILHWEDMLAKASPAPVPGLVIETDLLAILYTSGSTGKPKGVVLSHLNVVAGAKTVAQFLEINENDRLLSILTFGFDYGLNQLTTVFLKQAQIVLMEYLFPREIITHVQKFGITGMANVATAWIQLAQLPKFDQENMPSLRYITNSGGAIPENFVVELRRRLPSTKVFLMYGLTEAFRSTYLDPALVDKYPTSMGKAIPGEEIMIVDEHGKKVQPGQTGELVHRGVLVAQGYWNAPELTAIRYKRNPLQPKEVPIPEMAVFSGDQVRIDAEGFLYFVGRKDEMIKSSGIRISPTEVEEFIYGSGWCEGVMAMGIPHESLGHSVYLIVSPALGKSLSLPELEKYCKQTMPAYMVPQTIDIRESLPRNANGKVDRALLKKEVYQKLGIQAK